MLDRFLQRLGHILSDEMARRNALVKLRRFFRRGTAVLTMAALMGTALAVLLFRTVGERNLTLAFCLYLPRIVFLAPLVALLPVALVFHWKWCFGILAGAILFFHFGMDGQFRPTPEPSHPEQGKTLTVLTYNRGQHRNQSLQPFKDAILPDLIAFQEAGGRSTRYTKAEGYEAFHHGSDVGEFTVVSRYPILSTQLVEVASPLGTTTPAARFEIDFSGTPVALYSVHIISPRDTLNYYRRGAFLYGVIGLPGTSLGERRLKNQVFWDRRVAETRELARIIAADNLPVIVVGDFNAPAGGYIHGILRRHFHDAHLEAGSGFGYSFPGVTRNPLSRGGPWMRIDYLFCDKTHWQTTWCITEPDRPSQHRAVAAQFRLIDSTAPES